LAHKLSKTAARQLEVAQKLADPQATPHAPQLWGSRVVSVHVPEQHASEPGQGIVGSQGTDGSSVESDPPSAKAEPSRFAVLSPPASTTLLEEVLWLGLPVPQ
jgi:hypothetical protein